MRLLPDELADRVDIAYTLPMSVRELKEELATLPQKDQDEVIAFLFRLRHVSDREYERQIARRLTDKDRSHWLSPDEFERELDKKETR